VGSVVAVLSFAALVAGCSDDSPPAGQPEAAAEKSVKSEDGGKPAGEGTAAKSDAASGDSGPFVPPGEQTGKPFVLQMTPQIKMEFAWIPPGDYMTGLADGSNGLPRKKASFDKPFYIAIYEVTQEQWKAVMGGNPSLIRGDKYPVERVSWTAAQEFIRKMNEKYGSSGMKFDLPTEAQWEYCCRGGRMMKLNSGDDPNRIDEYAWMGSNSTMNGGPSLHPVGQKKANDWGLYDMQGNVAEWCRDLVSGEGASGDEEMHAVRGGNYHGGVSECLSTSRVPRRDDVKLRADGLRLMCSPTK
jgi:formylglycine-generating enzyme required for sulfatase activity